MADKQHEGKRGEGNPETWKVRNLEISDFPTFCRVGEGGRARGNPESLPNMPPQAENNITASGQQRKAADNPWFYFGKSTVHKHTYRTPSRLHSARSSTERSGRKTANGKTVGGVHHIAIQKFFCGRFHQENITNRQSSPPPVIAPSDVFAIEGHFRPQLGLDEFRDAPPPNHVH